MRRFASGLARISRIFSGNSCALSSALPRQYSEAVFTKHCPRYIGGAERRFSPKNCEKYGLAVLLWGVTACSPLASSPLDGSYELELTLHEVQTNLDDLRHDVSCFQTELHILDSRLKQAERITGGTKTQDLERQLSLLEQLASQIRNLEKRLTAAEKERDVQSEELRQLTTHANETTLALVQLKQRLEDHEPTEGPHILYTVKSGDSLEKIARTHHTNVGKIKQLNQLDQDLIVVGQILKLPKTSP